MSNSVVYKDVVAPLKIEEIKEYFQNKDIVFRIDCSASKIEGEMLLTYISNLDLPCELILNSMEKTKKFELLKNYLTTKSLCESSTLKLLSAQILLENVGVDSSFLSAQRILTRDEITEFIKENNDVVTSWATFVSSTMIYMLSSIEAISEEHNFKEQFQVIDDVDYVGFNVVNLFSVTMFIEAFFSVPAQTPIFYFKNQFEKYMFKGKSFYFYFAKPENMLLSILEGLLAGEFSLNELTSLENFQPDGID